MQYHFGTYSFDPARYTLTQAGRPVSLRPMACELLAYLLAHRDRVVPKEELLAQVWPGQYVGDAVLHMCILAVRRALHDTGRTPVLLHTVRGRGYRFVAPVEVRDLVLDDTPPALPPGRDAVLPLATPPRPPLLVAEASAAPAAAVVPHPVGEYKLVSVLCCGLPEAPALAARLGPEELYHLLQTVVALVQEVVQPYDGTFLPPTSEGVTAVFGAPVAQEDHARRAVLAALALHQRLRVHPALRAQGADAAPAARMGVHSGLAVVGTLSQDPQRLATVVGAPVSLALRLQQQAAPGTILLSAATYQLVQAEVRVAPCGTLAVDGDPTPMPVYTLQGRVGRHAGVAGRGRRHQSPFVGRARELARLDDCLATAMAGHGQMVALVGEPGMGKTRLVAEFCRRLPGDQVTMYTGQCLAYGQHTPYLPVRDLVQQVCGLMEGDTAAVHTATVQQRLHASGITAAEDVALLLQLLGLPVAPEALARRGPEVRQARTFALLRHLLLDAAQHQPLVLVVENLHWCDPTSAAWLASLVERLAGGAALLLGTYRPEYQPPWGRHGAVTQIVVSPLPPQDSRTIVQAVLGAVALPEAQLRAIVAQAAGNPFFLEELIWYVRDQGMPDTPGRVPEPVHAVLAARMDRLSSEAKHLLQVAAVVGPEVAVPLAQGLAELSEEGLHRGLAELHAAEFLYETRLFPDHVYTFKHALTHEVAYSSLLLERRRVLHARLVETLEALARDQVAEQVERLAHHALRGEVWAKAVTYCQQAAARAYDRAAFREAVAASEQALQALAHLPEDSDTRGLAIDLRFALGRSLYILGEYAWQRALLGEAEALARALDDRARLAQVLVRMSPVLRQTGDTNGAIASGQEALELAGALDDSALQVQASLSLGQVYYVIGDFGRAAALLRRNVETADREAGTPSTDVRIQSRAWLVRTLRALGAFAEGRRHGEEALRRATQEGRGQTPMVAHGCLGELYLATGDLEHAIGVLEQGLALCRTSGNRTWMRPIVVGLGYASALQGRLAEGRGLLEEAIREGLRTGWQQGDAYRVVWLSEVCRLAGRSEEAGQHARQALDLARQHNERANEALALHQLGVVHAHAAPPEVAQAETSYQHALALAEELGMRPLQAHCHRGLGTLYAKVERHEEARVELSAAVDLYHAMAMTFWLPETEAALAQVKER